MIYGLYFFGVYFVFGFALTAIVNLRIGNWKSTDWAMVIGWPFYVYFGIIFTNLQNRINRLEVSDVEGFCRLMKIRKLEQTRNMQTRCYIYTVTFKDGKEKRYAIYDREVVDEIDKRNNGVFFVMAKKIILKEVH